MVTKQEIEDELNDRLDLNMEWSKMKKEDLLEIRDGLEDEEFIKKFVAQYANDVAGDMAEDQVKGWQPGQFIQLASQMQTGESNPADFFL